MLVILTSCHPSHPYRGVTVTAAGSWGWARTKQWGLLAGCSVFECGGGVGDVMSMDVYSGGGGDGWQAVGIADLYRCSSLYAAGGRERGVSRPSSLPQL
jgi:hypothetical protein